MTGPAHLPDAATHPALPTHPDPMTPLLSEKKEATPKKPRYHGFIGLGVLTLAEILMLAGVQPFTVWFYSLAWWSYIMIADQAVYHLKGTSLWVGRRREFLALLPISAAFWLIFEGLNVYLKNWHYVMAPQEAWIRWPGYFVAYATVLPGLFETAELIEGLGWFNKAKTRPLPQTSAWHRPFALLGLIMLAGVFFQPRYFFPMTWLFPILLLEPVLYARGGPSLMRDLEQGNPRVLLNLLAAGLVCGLLWEFWNFWAETKWVYTVPFFSWIKVFEMPVLGFLGFPPFAVACYVMYHFVVLVGRGIRPPVVRWLAGAFAFAVVYVLVGRLIDIYNIRSFY